MGINDIEFRYIDEEEKLGKGHKGLNCTDDILFLKVIMRYIEVY